jgi:hypothetical protein
MPAPFPNARRNITEWLRNHLPQRRRNDPHADTGTSTRRKPRISPWPDRLIIIIPVVLIVLYLLLVVFLPHLGDVMWWKAREGM